MKVKLDKEEKELLESVERGEWKSVPNLEKEKKRHQKVAHDTLLHHAKTMIRGLKKRKTG
ncbi:MAG: hypothetical protein WC975_15455 [Phycisphaerae bacterium]